MSRMFVILAAVIVVVLILALTGMMLFTADQGPGSSPRDRMQKILEMDINEDGYITWDEWDLNERMFDRFDADGSGDLDPDEIDAIRQRMEQRGAGRRGERPQRRSFEEMDVNADSVITADEFRGPEEAFSRTDTDGDGQITREEMKADWPHFPTFEEMDADGDSVITADEFRGNQTAFSRADVNGDGQITREEMEGALAFPAPPDPQ